MLPTKTGLPPLARHLTTHGATAAPRARPSSAMAPRRGNVAERDASASERKTAKVERGTSGLLDTCAHRSR